MNCHYCHNLCRNNVSTWICDICPAEFGRGFTNLYTHINNKKYTFQMRFEHTEFPARIICPNVSILSLPKDSPIESMIRIEEHIINLPKIPDNITPSNVQEKIKLYLLFS